MTVDLDAARSALPLPELVQRLGYGDRSQGKTPCPFHADKTPSFHLTRNGDRRWRFKCFGCGEGGDEVRFLELARGMSTADAIRDYGAMSGQISSGSTESRRAMRSEHVPGAGVEPNPPRASESGSSAPPAGINLEAAKLEPLALEQVAQIADWRGYSRSFVERIAKAGVIGSYRGCVAFPVAGGAHYRKAPDWFYTKGAKPTLFEIGDDPLRIECHAFESPWDALAAADVLGLQNSTYIATRGTANAKLLAPFLATHPGITYIWLQNDEPGAKWGTSVLAYMPPQRIARFVIVPKPHKDLNAWVKAGATRADLDEALKQSGVSQKQPNRERLADISASNGAADNLSGPPHGAQRDAATGLAFVPHELERPAHPNLPAAPVLAEPLLESSLTRTGGEARESTQTQKPCHLVTETQSDSRGGGQSLSATLDAIAAFLARYMSFQIPEYFDITALWIVHTWVYKSFRWTPYMHIVSPARECGKSTLLACLNALCRAPWQVVAPSPAAIYTKIEEHRPTVLIDEVHNVFNSKAQSERNSTLQAILEAGYEEGLTVPRCPNGKLVESEIYSPKAMAGLGGLPDTIESRSITLHLSRCSVGDVTEYDDEEVIEETQPLKQWLEQWAVSAATSMKQAKPHRPPELKPRQRNICKPLLAIAEAAGEEWTRKAREACVVMFSKDQEMSVSEALLSAIRSIFNTKGRDTLSTIELLDALISTEIAGAEWVGWWERDFKGGQTHKPAQKLAQLLKPYSIAARTVDVDQEEQNGYVRADFTASWASYLKPLKMETPQLL